MERIVMNLILNLWIPLRRTGDKYIENTEHHQRGIYGQQTGISGHQTGSSGNKAGRRTNNHPNPSELEQIIMSGIDNGTYRNQIQARIGGFHQGNTQFECLLIFL